MILGQPLFTGRDGINQLVEIIKVLGTPTSAELKAMNPNYPEYTFTPQIAAHGWDRVLKGTAPKEASDLASLLMRYDPTARIPPLHSLLHAFFDDLRTCSREKSEGHLMLFNFMEDELWWATPQVRKRLVPEWAAAKSGPTPRAAR
mmetsp:Transcript_73623/g.239713  ORF Transcript_73623/g.239713 Transcript_73623/m.239713 type:complete len:146 (-) Transcript_73623:10-447(-)